MSAATVAEKVVLDELTSRAAKLPPEVRQAFLEGITRTIKKALAGERGIRKKRWGDVRFPRRFLESLGERRTHPTDPVDATGLAHIYESATARKLGVKPGFAKRFGELYLELRTKHPGIAAATDWTDFMVFMAQHEGKALPRTRFENLERKIAGQAAEDVSLGHPGVLAEVETKQQEMAELAGNPDRLLQFGLASLDPTPRIHLKFHAPPAKGATEGLFKYIDFGVVFSGVSLADPKATRQVVGIKGQVKLWLTEQLVRHVDLHGRERTGQLVKDEVRGPRGAWHIDGVRIPREEIIDDPRLRTLLTLGSQELTDAQRAALAKDGIAVKHFVHSIPYGEFYAFARTAMKKIGITIAP